MPDATGWLGIRIDDAYGARVGDVEDVYLEADGTPRWIFTRPARVLIPAQEAMAGAGRVWVPYEKELIKGAPAVASLEYVTPEHEAATWRWYTRSGTDQAGWVSHRMPWVRGYDADAARDRRARMRGEQPQPPRPEPVATRPEPMSMRAEPLPPLREASPPPLRQAPPPPETPVHRTADGRPVVMVFNIGCDDQAQRAPQRPADEWDLAAARALDEYARRTGTYR